MYVSLIATGLLIVSASALAQKAIPLTPSSAAPLPAADVEPASSPESDAPGSEAEGSPEDAEALRIVNLYESLPPDEQEQMRLLYETQEIDLLELVAKVRGDAEQKPVMPKLGRKDFKRTPKNVLAARTKLAVEEDTQLASDASPANIAKWLHLHVMAGQWDELTWFLGERAGEEGEAIYSHILQSTNQGDPMLLPEEVLTLANAAPEGDAENPSPTAWQVDILGKLLKRASARSSIGPMLSQLKAGTRLFGGDAPDNQARTAALLTRAGLSDEALAYLPSLESARESGNGRDILIHGLYHADRDETIRSWQLMGEAALLSDEEFELRQEALRAALSALPEIPETEATAWLNEVFADERLAPAALEVIALDAITLDERKLSDADRASAVLVMKSAVQTLLDSGRVDSDSIKVPLRMLTTGLVAEAEAAAKPTKKGGGSSRRATVLMRALPDESWLDSLEPSLAARAYRAFVGVATMADEVDTALEILDRGVERHPDDAAAMGEDFLTLWVKRLRPDASDGRDAAMRGIYMLYGSSNMTAAPLTRGRQARNLDRLVSVLDMLDHSGVDARAVPGVVEAFRACHSRSEAFSEPDITRVLGPIDELPSETAADLASAMRSGLSGDWRSRQVQQRFGMRRNSTEMAHVIEDGYATSMKLIERALAEDPESWKYAIARAQLASERLEHRRSQSDEELADYEQLREDSFNAFRDAAVAYAASAGRGEVDASADVFQAWFNAAIGAADLSQVTRDNVLYEGSERDTQIERIRETLLAMPPALAEEHLDLFAGALTDAAGNLSPEVKPRVVRHALRIIGDHPSGAGLRRLNSLYDDLVQDEIHLRLTIDGPDRVGTDEPFGAVLTLRYTNAVDRETDGFSKYLMSGYWVNMGRYSREVDYRDRLERAIRDALAEGFEIEGLGFFRSMHPSREVIELGQTGWQEKPLAYLILKATDESIERIPSIAMDLDFMDQRGPVILPVESNAPLIDASERGADRPVKKLVIEQIVDVRNADSEVVLDIKAAGRGVHGQLDEILSGIDDAIPGFDIAEDGVITHPIQMIDAAEEEDYWWMSDEDDDEYAGVDDDGIHRQMIERSWTVTYTPTAAATSGEFVMPTVRAGVEATSTNRTYSDMDLVEVADGIVPLAIGFNVWTWVLALAVLIVGAIAATALFRNRPGDDEGINELDRLMPGRPTPLGVVAALERIERDYGDALPPDRRSALHAEIGELQDRYFGRQSEAPNGHLQERVESWAREAVATHPRPSG
jgi:hypothetical protein